MAKDVSDMLKDTMSNAVRDAAKSIGDGSKKKKSSNGALSGMRGVAAGAGLAALAPIAAKGAGKAAKRRLAGGAAKSAAKKPGRAAGGVAAKAGDVTSKLGDSIGKGVGDKVKEKVDESGGAGGLVKEGAKGLLPFGGGGSGGGAQGGAPGVGKGRRMPVQQSMDVAVPIETCYNQWTQFEEWPTFMHRVTRVTQEEPCKVSFASKIWGKTKEFTADIETQRPDERIKWRVSQGITHTGVVTFHELAPRLTRVELTVDVDPGSLLEKAARGMRHIKRAMRADLHRFKAYIEMQEQETGAWRGVIEDGEVVEDHDPEYDEYREYADGKEARGEDDSERGEDDSERDEDEGEDADAEAPQAEAESEEAEEDEGGNGAPEKGKERFERQARATSGRKRGENGRGGSGSSAQKRSTSRRKAQTGGR